MRWLAIYIKYLPESEYDPFACESHGWEVEAESSDQALEIIKAKLGFGLLLCVARIRSNGV